MKKLITFTICIILSLLSCAKEEEINMPGPEDPSINNSSKLADLIMRTTMNDGSNDNIIDRANCFNLKLPVLVIANGHGVHINSEGDFEGVEEIFEEFDNDIDILEIIFPVTIILNDFTQILVTSQSEFDDFSNNCNGENEIDGDIECIDFQYPITGSVFNSITELIVDVTIQKDEEMYNFIKNLDENDTASINFPIKVLLFDGEEISIESLEQLEESIDTIKDECDEDDDFDFDDDDCSDCTIEQLNLTLHDCDPWTVGEFEFNGSFIGSDYAGVDFSFVSTSILSISTSSGSVLGTWDVSGSGNDMIFTMNIPSMPEFNGDWEICEIIEEFHTGSLDLKLGDNHLKFIGTCF